MSDNRYLDLYVVGMINRAEALIPTLPPLAATDAAYARISDDPEGLELGTTRQIEDARKVAAGDGVEIPDESVFTDDDISASTLSRRPRPDFERLIAYVLAGQIKRVYAYSNSRLTRRPMELEILILLAMQYGLTIKTAVSGSDDLNTADGRQMARIKAGIDAGEAEKTSERVKRQKQQRLASGLPPGSRYRTFGYTAPAGGKQNPEGPGWQVIPDEADIVVEVFDRVASGESVNSVANDLRARGVRTSSGGLFTFQATSRILDSSIYAGFLSYQGEVVGRANITPIITEAALEAAKRRSTAPSWNTRSHLLSGIAICGSCKTSMNFAGAGYACSRMLHGCGKVRINEAWLESAVEAAVRFLIVWQRAQLTPLVTVAPTPEIDPVVQIDRKIEEAQQAHTGGEMELADLLPILRDLRAQRAKLVEAKGSAETEDASSWRSVSDYDSADLSVKRSIIKRHIVAVPVAPSANRGNNRYDPSRITVVTSYAAADGSPRVLTGPQCDMLKNFMDLRRWDDENPGEVPDLADQAIGAYWDLIDSGKV